jgi:hypothetical protein
LRAVFSAFITGRMSDAAGETEMDGDHSNKARRIGNPEDKAQPIGQDQKCPGSRKKTPSKLPSKQALLRQALMEHLDISRSTLYDYLANDLIPNTQLKRPRGKRLIRDDAIELILNYGMENWRRGIEQRGSPNPSAKPEDEPTRSDDGR